MERTGTSTIGLNRGKPRLWIEGKYLAAANFPKGCKIRINEDERGLVIRTDEDGDRTVSGRRDRPIIDVNTKALAQIFQPSEKVLVTVTDGMIRVESTDADRIRVRVQDKTAGSAFPVVDS